MRIFRHYHDIPDAYKGAVVALGNFDGVHRGHQALIGAARRMAEERKAPLGVVAFEPHPQEFFKPELESFRLTPFRTKARLIAELGADAMFALLFDAEMAKKQAHEFVLDVLVGALGVGAIVVGEDFRFGEARTGDVTMLKYMGEQEGFGVTVFEPVAVEAHEKISSTRIREALQQGRPEDAAALLGHWWSIEARVEHGDARGRTIGFPTANMHIGDTLRPAYGVYAVRVTVFEEDKPVGHYGGVANFGVRPMYRIERPLLETFLFDFDGDLYGKYLSVELIHYIRPEAKFSGLDALKAQITKDSDTARSVLGSFKK